MVFGLCPESDVRDRIGAMISSSDRALLVVDRALEHKREFLSTWEIQFLNSVRVSYRHHSELTVAQKQMIRDIGKRLCLVD